MFGLITLLMFACAIFIYFHVLFYSDRNAFGEKWRQEMRKKALFCLVGASACSLAVIVLISVDNLEKCGATHCGFS